MRTLGRVVLAGLVAALAASPLLAHKGHPSPSPSPEVTLEAAEPTLVAETNETAEEPGALQAIPWRTAFRGHLHNKIVHFPLALGLAAAVLFLVAPRWPAYEPAARALLIAAAVAAVAAYLSGGAQEEAFEDSPFHSVVELHEKFGIGTAITLWIGVALTFWARARRFLPVYGLLLILLLSATGFLGGVLSHS